MEVRIQQSIHVLTRRAAGSRNGEGGGDQVFTKSERAG